MAVKLSGSLPTDFERNGMYRVSNELVDHPSHRHLVLAIVDNVRTTVDHAGEEDQYHPTARVVFIEPIEDAEDRQKVLDIFSRTRATRLGDGTLDFDFGVEEPSGPIPFDPTRTAGGQA